MALTVLKPSGLTSDPFVALKIELGKAVFPFKVALVATVNMFPPIANTNAVESKGVWSASPQQPSIWEMRKEKTNRSISLAYWGTGQRPFSGRKLGR